jgi:glycosyltransferase involved in cell wall biosynthesis
MSQSELPVGSGSLAILIPTWDRPEEVRLRLDEIAAQFGTGQRVHVQVNPGTYGLDDLCLSPMMPGVTGALNDANVGFIANIIYGIAHLSEEWVWILGDDDSLSPDCAAVIAEGIRLASESAIAINFNQWSRKPIPNYRCMDGVELLEGTHFGDLLFISATVWRRSYFIEKIDLFIDLSYSRSSQVALLLEGLGTGKSEVLRFSSPLIDYRPVHRWSRASFVQRMATLLTLDVSKPCKVSLAYSLYPQWLWATRSGYLEVGEGHVKWSEWFLSSAATLIQIHRYNPFASARYLSELIQLNMTRRKGILRTRVAKTKQVVRNVIQRIRGRD